jgi:hypothetical protein
MKNLETIKLEDWLDELKPYQRSSIDFLIEKNGFEKAAEIWITSNGPASNVPFGGISQDTKPFFDRFKLEFQKFICGHPDYESDRQKLGTESQTAKAVYISIISGAVGAKIGYAATLLIPAVVILLGTIGQMGLNSYCAGIDFQNNSQIYDSSKRV